MHDATETGKDIGHITRILLGAIIFALLATVQFLRPSHLDLWWQAMFQALHAPLFGLVAILVLVMMPVGWPWMKRLAVTIGIVFALSLISEAAQIPMPGRSASLGDLVNDWAGALAFLAAGIVLLPHSPVPSGRGRYLLLAAAGLLAWPFLPFADVSAAYWNRYQQLPSIAPFHTPDARMFYDLNNAIVIIDNAGGGKLKSEIRFGKRGSSSINFHDPWSDWTGYENLLIDIENPGTAELPLTIRVHDEYHLRGDQPYNDRFNRRLTLAPGREPVRIALTDIENAPVGRTMDLRHIDGVVLFGSETEASRRFIIHDIRLE